MKLLKSLLGVSVLVLAGCASKPELVVNENDWKTAGQANLRTGSKSLVIIFDGSGSMCGEKIVQAKRAVGLYVAALAPDVSVGLVAFDNRSGAEKLADLSTDRAAFQKAIDGIECGGWTPLGPAVVVAYGMLVKRATSLGARGEYHIVAVTDGEADSVSYLTDVVNDIIGRTPVRMHTIGFQIGEDHVLNRLGLQIDYVSADNEKEIRQGLRKFLAEAEP